MKRLTLIITTLMLLAGSSFAQDQDLGQQEVTPAGADQCREEGTKNLSAKEGDDKENNENKTKEN